ncbi:HAD-IIIA family hydrolase [Pseudalkalibacillus sp. SCS-8]|uniref:D-glycero-alpha-D-manno-heptose-1,7-bisphosphate 7-phosphatase n=1 Tax=Pseudalkalibacillus nanhaiensis TaxID=3115291 RepID=UPI0032DB0D13
MLEKVGDTIKVAFFDRDGTIIKDYPDHDWSEVDQPEFIEGAFDTLKEVQARGYAIIIVTNQYLINEGFISFERYQSLSDQMLKRLAENGIEVKDIFYCPHRRDEGCRCMKPNLGMIEQAIEKYPDIDLNRSFMVGDSACDMELAERTGMAGYWITEEHTCKFNNVKTVKSIIEITDIVKGEFVWRKS